MVVLTIYFFHSRVITFFDIDAALVVHDMNQSVQTTYTGVHLRTEV